MTVAARCGKIKIRSYQSARSSHSLPFDALRPVSRPFGHSLRRQCRVRTGRRFPLSGTCLPDAFHIMIMQLFISRFLIYLVRLIGHAALWSTVCSETAIGTVWRKHRQGSGKASGLRTASDNAAPTAQADPRQGPAVGRVERTHARYSQPSSAAVSAVAADVSSPAESNLHTASY